MQKLKNYLVTLGPKNPVVRSSLTLHALKNGFHVSFAGDKISIRRGSRTLLVSTKCFVQVPILQECFDLFFRTLVPEKRAEYEFLDFSEARLHTYRESGASFYFPGIAEDYVMDAYTHWYTPKPGDVIWDAGAYAGATTYFFAQLVGPSGRVYALEPDDLNYAYLLRNIEKHQLHNVVPVKKALDRQSGTVRFNMDGSTSAGIDDYIAYDQDPNYQNVETLSLEDACQEFGCIPSYIKMDIEGAEFPLIEGAVEFLKKNPIHFAIESYHRIGSEYTYPKLERLFPELGYEVTSSDMFGQMFTWAKPKL